MSDRVGDRHSSHAVGAMAQRNDQRCSPLRQGKAEQSRLTLSSLCEHESLQSVLQVDQLGGLGEGMRCSRPHHSAPRSLFMALAERATMGRS